MAHIINLALNDPDEMKLVRKKATNSVRSMFVKVSSKVQDVDNSVACYILKGLVSDVRDKVY